MKARPNIQRWLLIVGCWFGFAALPLAHTITSTTAREASSPVEEMPTEYSEATLVRNVERREPAAQTVAAMSPRSPHRTDAAVSPCLPLTGHRWSNGLLAPLRT